MINKAEKLQEILHEPYVFGDLKKFKILGMKDLRKLPNEKTWVKDVYDDLKGIQKFPVIDARKPDFIYKDVAIVFDTSLDLNKYRTITLRSELYEDWNGIEVMKYRDYIRKAEQDALKQGSVKGIWTSPDAEIYFGKPSQPPLFIGNGAVGWKYIALQNFILDVSAYHFKKKIVHIAYNEQLLFNKKLMSIGDALYQPIFAEAIKKYIDRKIVMS